MLTAHRCSQRNCFPECSVQNLLKNQKKTDSWIAEGLGLVGLFFFFLFFLVFLFFLFFGFFGIWLCDTEDTEAFSIIHSLKYSVFALVY